MRQHDYAKDLAALSYPISELSEEEAKKIDRLAFDFKELTADHIVYGLTRAFGGIFHIFWKTMEEAVGVEEALKVSHDMGERFGTANFGNFLRSRGVDKGSPALMCEFQDKIHSVRGPVHISARFGWFDDKMCVVVRKRCFYHEWRLEGTAKYHTEFYRGLYDGYRMADPALKRVENPLCLHKGNESCRHEFIYKG